MANPPAAAAVIEWKYTLRVSSKYPAALKCSLGYIYRQWGASKNFQNAVAAERDGWSRVLCRLLGNTSVRESR
jgi:hypothetical protein